jgi:dihydroflavonol-4-reductase
MTNELVAPLSAGDVVAVTGAAGFIGSAVVRNLLARGAQVLCLVEPGTPTPNLDDLAVTITEVDIRDRAGVETALAGSRYCFHVAALYGFWPRAAEIFYEVNVEGSRNVVDAARSVGCERIVYTSTVATIGLENAHLGDGATESHLARVDHLFGAYKQTKYVAEHEVLRLAAQGAPVVLVQPTFPVGPGDRRPTPTGKVILDFLRGRMPGYVETTFNVAHVDDLAAGHVAALERGRQGASYIIGGENLAMSELLATLSDVSGLPFTDRKVPGALALGVGHASDFLQGRLLRREPAVPLEGARMATTQMRFDDRRARRELGHRSRPATSSLRDAVRFFLDAGYLDGRRADTVRRTLAMTP